MRIAALDIGTSSTRALLFEGARHTGEHAAVEYALISEEPGAAELDPAQVFDAVLECIARLRQGGAIDAVALSSAMHSLLAADAGGAPLTRALTWADSRAGEAAQALKQSDEAEAIYNATGVPLHPMSPLSKLRWLREARPAVFAQANRFVSLLEFVCHRLFGTWQVDHGVASSSGLYSLGARDWDAAALDAAGITAARLSKLVVPGTVLRGLNAEGVARTGLAADTPFVLCGSDGCLANLGAGALANASAAQMRRAVLTIGTSGAFRMTVDRPSTDAQMRSFCYTLAEHQFVIGGATNGGGMPLRWLRDNFPQLRGGLEGEDPYTALAQIAAQATPGAGGLLFHPYLAGERAPLWNADARGSFIGLNFRHGPPQLVRAVMEGILFNLAMILDVLEEIGGACNEILAGGGFARSPFWLQMAADLFGRPLIVADNPETTAQGAALMALTALGGAADLAAAVALLTPATRRIEPGPETHAVYAALQASYSAIPATLAPVYAELSRFQREHP
ncbi:MAG: gluconate kinase [Betaproteobacteria bacterium]|nr:gluconate kinase [Betaproteobacteria bacterium]